MTIAYLVNQYPSVSHSFIRREILALEASGVSVRRFALRPPSANLPDPDDRREAERTIVVLAQGTLPLFAAVLACVLTRPGRFFRALRVAIAMGQGTPKSIFRQLAYLAEACWLRTALRGLQHLHAHFGTNPAAVARLVHLLTGIPYSFTVHGPEEFDAPRALDLPGKIADARFVVAVSAFGRSQLMRWTDPKSWEKLRVIRCGIDEDFANAEPIPPCEVPHLCCVARLSGQKGLPLLVAAAALLKHRKIDFRLTLVGDGNMRAEIERAILDEGLGDRVTITGYLSADGVREVLSSSRAMILPSLAEGLPVVIMEALAMRTPVVVTAIAGIPELVDAACGWVVPAGAIDPLADAMTEVLSADPKSLRAMGQVGRMRVLAQHDARCNARQLGEAIGVM